MSLNEERGDFLELNHHCPVRGVPIPAGISYSIHCPCHVLCSPRDQFFILLAFKLLQPTVTSFGLHFAQTHDLFGAGSFLH